MKYIHLFAILFFIALQNAFGQVIWTEPVFPLASEGVTVFFDATQGTGGLENCNCDIYLHTGVITSQSSGASDWKYVVTSWGVANNDWKMTAVVGQPNIYSYEITPTIRAYYGVPLTETIEQMAFVFRNGDGTLEGKDTGGADIFYTVHPEDAGFSASFLAPSSSSLLVAQGEDIDVNIISSASSTITLFDNGNIIDVATGTSLTHTINVQNTGTNTVVFTADNGSQILTDSFTYTIPLALETANLPTDVSLGINYHQDNSNAATLALYAPNKEYVFLTGDFNNWAINTDYQLKNTPDGNIWWIELNNLSPGEEYAFQYIVNGNIRIADPYAEKVLDPWNDSSIPENVYPNLKPYPVGQTTGVVSILQTDQSEYAWSDEDFIYPEKSNLFIYELHLHDFLASHSYIDLLDTLGYLERLGVTAIELMPVSEFEGNQSWGYNPSFHGALDKYYGTPDALKDFINEAHNRGIAVILDVVYNHAFSQSPLAQLYWDDANFRPRPDNPWLNPVAKHPYNVGYDFNHESAATKNYVKQTLATWINKYHIDGFRFDLSKGFSQRQANNSNFGNYDASRIAILKDYADFIWDIDPDNYVILEHFATNSEEKELSAYGMMLWGNMNHEYNEATMGYTSNLSWVSHQARNWDEPHLIGYMESHDEERLMYKNSLWGNSSGSYDVTDLNTGLSRVELASTFFLTIPGPKMIWQFGELGYDFSINRCTNGTINENCRLDPKPIRWDYAEDENRMRVYTVMSQLAELKKTEAVFSTDDFDYNLSGSSKKIHLNGDSDFVTIIGNFGMTLSSIDPAFQQTGWWYEFFSGDSLLVNDVNANIALNAGDYRLYSTKRLSTATQNVANSELDVSIFPNPTSGQVHVNLGIENTTNLSIELLDIAGRPIKMLYNDAFIKGQNFHFNLEQPNQFYLLRFIVDQDVFYRKIIIQK